MECLKLIASVNGYSIVEKDYPRTTQRYVLVCDNSSRQQIRPTFSEGVQQLCTQLVHLALPLVLNSAAAICLGACTWTFRGADIENAVCHTVDSGEKELTSAFVLGAGVGDTEEVEKAAILVSSRRGLGNDDIVDELKCVVAKPVAIRLVLLSASVVSVST